MILKRLPLAGLTVLSLSAGLTIVGACAEAGRGDHNAALGRDRSCAYFVSPTGDDRNDGRSPATAFRTLREARSALRRGDAKVACLRAGTYRLEQPLSLGPEDEGETWRYYAPDGVDTAVLEGDDRVGVGIDAHRVSNLTIDGVALRHFKTIGISAVGPANNLVVENCEVGFISDMHSDVTVAINVSNTTNATVSHNYVHDTVAMGISVYAYNARESADGDVVTGNVLLRSSTARSDTGAIYTDMLHTGTAGGRVTISNNLVKDWGGSSGNQHAVYLDDNSSNVTVTGNVLAPPQNVTSANYNGTSAYFVHNGSRNTFTNNIVELGDSGHVVAGNWGQDRGSLAGMGSNSFTGNIILASNAGDQKTAGGATAGNYTYIQNHNLSGDFTIRDNLYYNHAGGEVSTSGNLASDSHPRTANPLLSAPTYRLAGNSPAYSLLNFTPIVGGWGPRGFVMPKPADPR